MQASDSAVYVIADEMLRVTMLLRSPLLAAAVGASRRILARAISREYF